MKKIKVILILKDSFKRDFLLSISAKLLKYISFILDNPMYPKVKIILNVINTSLCLKSNNKTNDIIIVNKNNMFPKLLIILVLSYKF